MSADGDASPNDVPRKNYQTIFKYIMERSLSYMNTRVSALFLGP